MPKAWGRVSRAEMDLRPGGIFSIAFQHASNSIPRVRRNESGQSPLRDDKR